MVAQSLTIRDGLRGRQNSFGALRLAFAAAVIISHSFPLSGRGNDPLLAWWNGQSHLGTLAVYGFLGISGYVVTKSAARLSTARFAWHRVLRLYPAYWLALILCAFVLAPAAWAMEGRSFDGFWSSADGPFAYLRNNWTLWVNQWDVNNVFEKAPVGVSPAWGSINGSLWTLAFEMQCYVWV